jgi:hypothetical protein
VLDKGVLTEFYLVPTLNLPPNVEADTSSLDVSQAVVLNNGQPFPVIGHWQRATGSTQLGGKPTFRHGLPA